MQIKNLALLATALAGAQAEFAIFTIPTPTDLGVLANPASFINSVQNYVTQQIASLTASAGPNASSAASRAASANSALQAFVKTATISIPSSITEIGGFQTFTSVPAWYSALPSDVKSYYDGNNAKVQSFINQAILGTAAPSGSVMGSASKTGAAAASGTGAAGSEKVVKYVGAGMMAAFAGVVAL